MKIYFIFIFFFTSIFNQQLHGGSSHRFLADKDKKVEDPKKQNQSSPKLVPVEKEVSASTSIFDPKQEETVIIERNKKDQTIKNIKEYIRNLKGSFSVLKAKLHTRIGQMKEIVDNNLENKEKYQLTVSNLKFLI